MLAKVYRILRSLSHPLGGVSQKLNEPLAVGKGNDPRLLHSIRACMYKNTEIKKTKGAQYPLCERRLDSHSRSRQEFWKSLLMTGAAHSDCRAFDKGLPTPTIKDTAPVSIHAHLGLLAFNSLSACIASASSFLFAGVGSACTREDSCQRHAPRSPRASLPRVNMRHSLKCPQHTVHFSRSFCTIWPC